MKSFSIVTVLLTIVSTTYGADYLVKLKSIDAAALKAFETSHGGKVALVSAEGRVIKWTTARSESISSLDDSRVEFLQPNRTLSLPKNPSLEKNRAKILEAIRKGGVPSNFDGFVYPDNPEFTTPISASSGADPKVNEAWGMDASGAKQAWKTAPQGKGIVVAVTDTGVDYNHEDLVNSMWRNKNEIAGNGIDDDKNGYVDDMVGWDFFSNDNKPYDAILTLMEILTGGGNPGHGTHVSGVIAAQLNNSLGIAGVAPQAKIMALRFLSEKGQGSTEGGIKCIDYAVANGANIINASWGGEKDAEDDTLLKEAIQRAEKKGVLFMVAAGNGRMGMGYDNDNDPKPVVPASYDYANMVCVSAIDSGNALGAFSNWGARTCKLGAPGVKILSTVPGSRYQDTIIELGTMKVTWDGTSMATPFVAGAAAVIWSMDVNQSAKEVRQKLFDHVVATPSLSGKVSTGGRMDLNWIK